VDLNGDGKIDILSGSYSRHDKDMAGLFQVLWGKGKGRFKKAEVLNGSDGEPLIITATKKTVTEKICTRPTAVDLDGDGKLDIVSGNFSGSFAVFAGLGKGRFEPKNSILMTGGSKLTVRSHSDPFFVDWDGDGDLDLISGSSQGGVSLCTNTGTVTQAAFAHPTELLAAAGYRGQDKLGDAHVTGPQSATRVFVDDVNGDGKLDILIGDSVHLTYAADGLDDDAARAKLAAWNEKQQEWSESNRKLREAKATKDVLQKSQQEFSKLWKARGAIVRSEGTGFVWVMLQK
jgi:hypothetical protein